jgi:pentatricopeptide repeat protein
MVTSICLISGCDYARRRTICLNCTSISVRASLIIYVYVAFVTFVYRTAKRSELRFDFHQDAAYLALLRCHADAVDFGACFEVLEEMKAAGIELRTRCFQPIFEVSK